MLSVSLAAAGVAFPSLAEAACNPPVIGAAELDVDPIYSRGSTLLSINYHDQCSGEQQTRVYVADAIGGGGWQLIQQDGYNSGGWRQATASDLDPGGSYCFEVEVDGSDDVTRRSKRFCTYTNSATSYPAGEVYDAFYTRMLTWRDIDVISSSMVSSSARWEALDRFELMIGERVDLHIRLRQHDAYVAVLDVTEENLDLPECQEEDVDCPAPPKRGFGGVVGRPITAVGEENLLHLEDDPYYNQDIFVHEFGHTVFNLTAPDGLFDAVDACYEGALDDGLWANTYAGSTIDEYWAMTTQAWFDVGPGAQTGVHNHVNTRDELRDYDICIHDLLTYTYDPDHGRTFLDAADPSKDLHLWQYDSGRLAVTGGRSDGYYGAYVWEWNGASWVSTWTGWHAGAQGLDNYFGAQTFAPNLQIKAYRYSGSSTAMLPAPGQEAAGTTDRVRFSPAQ